MTNEAVAAAGECSIKLDGWRTDLAGWVWTHPQAEPISKSFHELAAQLASLVDRPDEVTLVIAMDFAEAVMRRDPSVKYTTDRGSGMVGGRTMPIDDDKVDVLIDANWLVTLDGRGNVVSREVGVELMRRSITHEAQHVVMHHLRSGFEAYGRDKVPGLIGLRLFDAATKVLDEHRAEWNAIRLSGNKFPTEEDVTAVLSALGAQLAAVDDGYQRSRDVNSLMEGAILACLPFWVSLAYWAAQYRTSDVVELPPAEIRRLPLWQRYVGDSWAEVAAGFCSVPVADLSTSPDSLHSAAQAMAAALRTSLHVVGFRYTEDEEGAAFYLNRADFVT